ncbi:amino acid permease-associated region [Heyndrickxia coagulans 2-6]|nr:amino acid permease-associated region [Heyndrickxia coagulans 2-6]
MTVRGYGEGEYWFSFIKVAAIILFIVVGLLMVFGLLGGKQPA